ncbi:RluA family pseudouridine synthase [Mesoplasma melaleucae]|uniref:Pseudouridine synthase n=1 Tax=Mesoplasma melaleucae TaxID=81459 RepID=A0A2K8NW58_9MOLU|nr:RluA family pseudouridine synthase [Mesoplasma melaleucae]ATZ18072.1 23S rRNA pseudouridine1911/1915/1917 synthase [Mesoplasma melaleucae]
MKFKANVEKVRLDKYLVDALAESTEYSRSFIQNLIKNGHVTVNGNIETKQNFNLQGEIEIEVTIPEVKPSTINAEKIDLDIIYEDDDILVVNKANNMVVHPGAGNTEGTMVNALLGRDEKFLSSIGGVERPGIVHRIDKQTTGLLIVAKNDKAHQVLTEMLKNHEIYKEYVALVWGEIKEEKGIIDAPIGRHQNDRKKMMVASKNSKYAVTNFDVIKRLDQTTLVKCAIETGRTHQIRVHFNFIKHPIVNDPAYGKLAEKPTDFGQMLHAYKLEFWHPITKEMVKLKAELPKEFKDKIIEEGGVENDWKTI